MAEYEVPVWFVIESVNQSDAWEKVVKVLSEDFARYQEYGVANFSVEEPIEVIDFLFPEDILPDYDEDKPVGDDVKEE